MPISLRITDTILDTETFVQLDGDFEEDCMNLIALRFVGEFSTLEVADASGEFIPYEDFIYESPT